MGTKDHPEEDAYNTFLQKNSGSSNAYTTGENTNYYFSVNNDALFEALSIFSGFFTCPLFLESCVHREIKAVDNEHSKNLQNDTWRTQQLIRTLARKDHPLNHFCSRSFRFSSVATGDASTLTLPDIRKRAIAFHSTYYAPSVMKLVVLSTQPASVLRGHIETLFQRMEYRKSMIPVTSVAV